MNEFCLFLFCAFYHGQIYVPKIIHTNAEIIRMFHFFSKNHFPFGLKLTLNTLFAKFL